MTKEEAIKVLQDFVYYYFDPRLDEALATLVYEAEEVIYCKDCKYFRTSCTARWHDEDGTHNRIEYACAIHRCGIPSKDCHCWLAVRGE